MSEKPRPQLILCLVPNNNKDTYDAIKKTCCIEYPVPSQVITSNILNGPKARSVITKVALQVNCKLGGELWGVTIPPRNIMVVGMDVNKDTSRKDYSVAAFVSSMNGNQENKLTCTRYFSRCAMQAKGQEFVDTLQTFMKDALLKYQEKNGVLPDRVFVYRDGVSDGQLNMVSQYEVPQMRRAFKDVNETYEPKLSVIVVKKRSNSRFFMKNDRGDVMNAPMGTAISDKVVKHGGEFYLISQSTNQGTVSPTHYVVIEGMEHLEMTKMQTITYRFTHLYYNWPGQIRVPAQCQYAAKLSRLVGETLHKPHAPGLDELLFYL